MNSIVMKPANSLCDALRGLIIRLEDVLECETADLRRNDYSRFAEYTRQKDLLLLDISRLEERFTQDRKHGAALEDDMRRLRAALEKNGEALKLYLATAREFAGSIEDIIRRHQSDGTYTRCGGKAGYGRW